MMTKPVVLPAPREEFEKAIKSKVYKSPLPEDARPHHALDSRHGTREEAEKALRIL